MPGKLCYHREGLSWDTLQARGLYNDRQSFLSFSGGTVYMASFATVETGYSARDKLCCLWLIGVCLASLVTTDLKWAIVYQATLTTD